MKNLITITVLLFAFIATAQDYTLMHINAKWNQSNNFNLRGIKGANVQYAMLEDQKPSLKAQIKSVPIIILLDKNGKPRGQWKAGLSFKITATKDKRKVKFATRTKISIMKNHVNGLGYEDGKILVTAHGFLKGKDAGEEKKSIEVYKSENSEYWKDIIGSDGDYNLAVEETGEIF